MPEIRFVRFILVQMEMWFSFKMCDSLTEIHGRPSYYAVHIIAFF